MFGLGKKAKERRAREEAEIRELATRIDRIVATLEQELDGLIESFDRTGFTAFGAYCRLGDANRHAMAVYISAAFVNLPMRDTADPRDMAVKLGKLFRNITGRQPQARLDMMFDLGRHWEHVDDTNCSDLANYVADYLVNNLISGLAPTEQESAPIDIPATKHEMDRFLRGMHQRCDLS